ncbi:MAG: glycosyltransferase family 61 protein, partial [Deltaproteobacteria bacterium]|nr:glycosyltransferase family 61 protein [Deltaproteobacteria bacterium]
MSDSDRIEIQSPPTSRSVLKEIPSLNEYDAVRCDFHRIDSSITHTRAHPAALRPTIHWKLAKEAAVRMDGTYVARLMNAMVVGAEGAVITCDGYVPVDLIHAYGRDPRTHPVFDEQNSPQCCFLAGRSLLLGTRGGARNYFHWMFDIIPRFLLFKRSRFALLGIDHFLLNALGSPFQFEALAQLDIPLDRVKLMRDGTGYSCEELIV